MISPRLLIVTSATVALTSCGGSGKAERQRANLYAAELAADCTSRIDNNSNGEFKCQATILTKLTGHVWKMRITDPSGNSGCLALDTVKFDMETRRGLDPIDCSIQ